MWLGQRKTAMASEFEQWQQHVITRANEDARTKRLLAKLKSLASGNSLSSELAQEYDQLLQRHQIKPAKIDNGSLKAGHPMFYYCRECEYPAHVLPEEHREVPQHYCGACKHAADAVAKETGK
jgi:hypothetical protein